MQNKGRWSAELIGCLQASRGQARSRGGELPNLACIATATMLAMHKIYLAVCTLQMSSQHSNLEDSIRLSDGLEQLQRCRAYQERTWSHYQPTMLSSSPIDRICVNSMFKRSTVILLNSPLSVEHRLCLHNVALDRCCSSIDHDSPALFLHHDVSKGEVLTHARETSQ